MSQSISQWETWYHSSLPFTPCICSRFDGVWKPTGALLCDCVTYNQLVLWLREGCVRAVAVGQGRSMGSRVCLPGRPTGTGAGMERVAENLKHQSQICSAHHSTA